MVFLDWLKAVDQARHPTPWEAMQEHGTGEYGRAEGSQDGMGRTEAHGRDARSVRISLTSQCRLCRTSFVWWRWDLWELLYVDGAAFIAETEDTA